MPSPTTKSAKDYGSSKIYFYIPNVIGYVRVLFSLLGVLWLYDHPAIFTALYIVSFVFDALDGHVARAFNQCSRFGAVLDMITDRFSTAALATVLVHFYPHLLSLMIFSNALDFASHWIRMYSSLVTGETSHKSIKSRHPRLLSFYYTNKIFMAALCIGAEIFYMALYWMHFYDWSFTVTVILFYVILCPLWLTKQVVNVLQLTSAAQDIVEAEYELDAHHKSN